MVIIICIIIFLLIIRSMCRERKLEKEKDFYTRYGLPSTRSIISINELSYNDIELKNNYRFQYISFIWKDGVDLNIVGHYDKCEDYGKIIIPIDKINYYTRMGDFYTTIQGGGSSMKGAIVGGAIAGDVGATIGSREKLETKQIDNRTTILSVTDKYGKEKIIKLSSDSYDVLFKIIPEKEKNIVESSKCNKLVNNNEEVGECKSENTYNQVINQIRELAKLKDENILSEEEFDNKKRELLNKIQ